VNHKPATLRPFDQVREGIARQLAQQEALAQARKQGTERLDELKKGNGGSVRFGPTKLVSRDNPLELNAEALSQVFGADGSKLPSYAGVETREGYAIYRISRVVDPEPDDARARGVQSELGRASGSLEFNAFLDGLRADTSVDINKEYLEKKQQ